MAGESTTLGAAFLFLCARGSTEDEIVLYREWIENNRELERIVTEMRDISSRVLALITGREVP